MLTEFPSEIQQHFEDLTGIVVEALHPQAIYLLGSAARGELSWLRHPSGEIELFSDYEFAVITQQRPRPEQRNILERVVRSFEQQLSNPNPLFHIDILFRERQRLAVMPHLIFTFEFKQNGLLLYGEELRDMLPDVTLANLDMANTHEILYKRLWAILLYLPESFALGNPSLSARRVAGYSFCRNALDLTTVFLPGEGVLLPTYRQRVKALNENAHLLTCFGRDFPIFMQTCLDRRLDLDFASTDLLQLYATTIDYLERGLLMLLHSSDINTLPQRSRNIFNEHPISRGEWYNLARLAYHKAKNHNPYEAVRWLRLPVKGWLTLGLLMMHKSLLSWLHDQEQEAVEYLNQSEYALHIISTYHNPSQLTGFPEKWFALKRAWSDICLQTILLKVKDVDNSIKKVMEWHYA